MHPTGISVVTAPLREKVWCEAFLHVSIEKLAKPSLTLLKASEAKNGIYSTDNRRTRNGGKGVGQL